jgi:Uma2 family endonuclease
MSEARKRTAISVEEYLAGESISQIKHEYLDGFVYAMAGANNRHNKIKVNILVSLQSGLRRKPCRAFDSDTKIRLRSADRTRFYYPDVSVVCRENADGESFQDEPVVIVEVLSKAARRLDEREKKEAYLSIPSLGVYLLVEQETAAVIAFRRGEDGFDCETYDGLEAFVPLPEIGVDLPLSDIYDAVEFFPETDDGAA